MKTRERVTKLEEIIFNFISYHDGYVEMVGHPTNAATMLYPNQNIRLRWSPKGQIYCTYCGKTLPNDKQPWINLDGETYKNRFNQPAIMKEAVCVDHQGKINPCKFNGQQKYAPRCSISSPRCIRMFSQCSYAVLYVASSDIRLKSPIKIGQTSTRQPFEEIHDDVESALTYRITNGGYTHAISLESPMKDLWLGSAQRLESIINTQLKIPDAFLVGGVAKKTAKPFFIGNDNIDQLKSTAHYIVNNIKRISYTLMPNIRAIAETLEPGETFSNKFESLVDKDSIEKLDEDKIQCVTRKKNLQDISMELLGVRGKYIIGKDLKSSNGILINLNNWKGRLLGVKEI
jgi:hypothetical protein